MECPQCAICRQQKELVCDGCGLVFGGQKFTNEIAFMENGGGAFQQTQLMGSNALFDKEIQGTLDYLKSTLEVDYEYFEAFDIARRLLRLAYQINSKLQYLKIYAGAALYFGFRCKQAPYLLIDISDKITNCSVIKLARFYLKLLRFLKQEACNGDSILLSQNFQFIDPSIYIPKFVKVLEFKDKQFQIIETAKKLVKRMMLDWMSYGRRPSSLCGAALLISARFHGENLSTATVCKTVSVCDETIRKRLAEFNQTGLSQLTREQFEQIQNIETEVPGEFNDPPAYTRARAQEKEKQKQLEEDPLRQKELEEQTMKKALQLFEILKKKPEIIQKQDEQQYPIQQLEIPSNTKVEVKENLSELDPDEEAEFLLNQAESDQKKVIWANMYKDWIQDKEQMKKRKLNSEVKVVKKRKSNLYVPSNAQSMKEAIKLPFKNSQLNEEALNNMFPEQPTDSFMDEINKLLQLK